MTRSRRPAHIPPIDLSDRARKRLKAIEKRNRQRARRAGVEVEPVDFISICEEQGWRCAICDEPMDPEIIPAMPLQTSYAISLEHSPALSAGGTHTSKHVYAAHLRCNLEKGAGEDTQRAAKAKRQAGETGQQKRRKAGKASKWPKGRGFQTNRSGRWKAKTSGGVEERS